MPDATHTPTTDELRELCDERMSLAEYDRAIAAHDAEIADKERDAVVAWLYDTGDQLVRNGDPEGGEDVLAMSRAIAANEHREGT